MRQLNIFLYMFIFCIISKSCKTQNDECTICKITPGDEKRPYYLDSTLGSINLKLNVWYAKDVDNDYNYADIFNNSNFPFEKLYSELNRDITGIPNVSEVVATTFFLNKILTSDSVVSLHDISAISIYLVRGGKFYHDFFLYDSAKKTFKKIDALHARIGGININTIHKLMTSVVNPKTGSSSLLIRNPRNFSKINGMTYPSNSLDELIYKYNKKYVARDEEEIGFSEATRS